MRLTDLKEASHYVLAMTVKMLQAEKLFRNAQIQELQIQNNLADLTLEAIQHEIDRREKEHNGKLGLGFINDADLERQQQNALGHEDSP